MNTGDPWGELMSASINAHVRRKDAEADDLDSLRQSLLLRLEDSFRDVATHTGLTEAIFKAVVKAHHDQWKLSSSKFPGKEEDALKALEALIQEGSRLYAAGTTFADIRKQAENFRLPERF